MTTSLWVILITAIVGAISGISAAFISYLNRKDIKAQATSNAKSGDPT